jgi:phosphatidyl-myo-inositol dimannoside synthase
MNIALLTTDSLPIVGGVSDYLHNLCVEIIKYDSLDVCSSVLSDRQYDGKLPYPIHRISDTRRLGERVGDGLTPLRKLNTLLWYLQRPSQAKNLLRKVQEETRPDLVFIGRWQEQSHYWCRACLDARIPYCLFAYGMELVESKPLGWQKKRRQDCISAHGVISISKATSKVLEELGIPQDQILLVPPGIRPENLQHVPKETLRHVLTQFDIKPCQYVLSLGRLIHRKGFDLVIRAFSELAREFPDLSLVIAGDGPEMAVLKSLAETSGLGERVRLIGSVNETTKRALMQSCAFFVMPNRPVAGDMEGFGIVFLEAAMYGKAVIGGNNGGVPDAVVNRETGLLIDTSGTHEPLVHAMRHLLIDKELRDRLGRNGHMRASREFSWGTIAQDLIQQLKKFNMPSNC